MAIETLTQRAARLRDSLQKSQTNTDAMVTILGSFDHRLSALDASMRPTQVRTHGIRIAHENVDRSLKSADAVLNQFDLCRKLEPRVLRGPHEDLEDFLVAVAQLRGCSEFFRTKITFKSSDGLINHLNSLLAKAISKLEDEFRQLLLSHSCPVELDNLFACFPDTTSPQKHDVGSKLAGSVSAEYRLPTLIPQRIIPLMHNLAVQLVQAKRQMECSKIYWESRGPALEQSLQKLGMENHFLDDIEKMSWEVLESKIKNWIRCTRVAVKLLFAAERQVCYQIFEGIESLNERCFAEVTLNSVQILFAFGEAVSRSKKSPEKLFAFLDMYEAVQELQSEIETIFEGKACSGIRGSASNLMKQLAMTVKETIRSFIETIEKEGTKAIIPDGKVHPLTSYVMNYVKYLLEYQSTLKLLFKELMAGAETNSQVGNVTMQLIQALYNNLEVKSKQYKDQALSHLFLMNNLHYMVSSVRQSEAFGILGDDWVKRHRKIVQQNATQYRRVAWTKILQSLSGQGLGNSSDLGSNAGASKDAVKERFKSFNSQFEELHQKQIQWIVPEAELRESLRLMIAEVLLPAYRSFVKRFGPLIENNRHADKFLKYTPEDIDRMLGEFFEGRSTNDQRH